MYHVLFICSSVSAHLGYFHLLAIVSKTAVNMVYKYVFKSPLSVLLDINPEVELLDHSNSQVNLLRNQQCFLQHLQVHHLIFPPAMHSFWLLHIFSTHQHLWLFSVCFDNSHLSECGVYCYGFDVRFPNG